MSLKAISLFSGVGGFEVGFARAGIETVLQAERDPWCLAVLARHWPETERVSDVRLVRGADHVGSEPDAAGEGWDGAAHASWEGIDLVYGGFPCQDLSVAGKRAGLGGERSGEWFEFHRVLRELRPRWAVVENVPGLLSSNEGRDFGVILDGLDELGFCVAWAVLDAQHFGVPQRRRRVFVVAGPTRRGVEQVLSLCESCGGNPETGRAAGEGVAATLGGGSTDSQRGFRDDLDTSTYVVASAVSASAGHHGHSSPRGDGSDNLVPMAIRTAQTGSNGWGVGTDEQAYTLDGAQGQAVVAPTIDAQDGRKWGSNQWVNNGKAILSGGVRRLTPLECERLQGWPDDHTRWTADGREISDSHRYRMVGNGVASPVAEWIGHRLVAVDGSLKPEAPATCSEPDQQRTDRMRALPPQPQGAK